MWVPSDTVNSVLTLLLVRIYLGMCGTQIECIFCASKVRLSPLPLGLLEIFVKLAIRTSP